MAIKRLGTPHQIPLNKRICNLILEMRKAKVSADSHCLTGLRLGAMGRIMV